MAKKAPKIDESAQHAVVVTKCEIVEFEPFQAELIQFKERYEDVVYDLTIPEQDRQARSDRFAIGKVISALDSRHAEIKAPLKAQVDLIDGARKRIKDMLLEVQGKIKGQIEKHESAIREKEAMLQARVDKIRELADVLELINLPVGLALEELSVRIKTLDTLEIDDSFENRKADAMLAKVETLKVLRDLHSAQEKAVAERAELERLRRETAEREQRDREERIRQEAADQARKDAETRAEREKLAAAEKAQEEINAANRAREAAERAQAESEHLAKEREAKLLQDERERVESERKAAVLKAEQERQAEEAKKARVNHRKKIEGDAAASLALAGIDKKVALDVIDLIKEGQVKNVSLHY